MKFQENSKPIYLQIADRICDEVSSGVHIPDRRIPSVREYAALLKVNANTVMRAFDYLASVGIIYNKRGLGYFIAANATGLIAEERRRTFFADELPYIFERLRKIGISPTRLIDLYNEYINQK